MTSQSFILITGASAGIGKALAYEFASQQRNLLLTSLPQTGLLEIADELRSKFSVGVHTYECDLTNQSAPSDILAWCTTNHFKVQVLVNNAGFGNVCSFQNMDACMIQSMMVLNNFALVTLVHLFIPEIKRNGVGYIMNVGSLASFLPIPNKALYSASKSFVYSFSSSLRLELKPHNIYVSCLCPGPTLTSRMVSDTQSKINYKGKAFIQLPEEVAKEAVTGMYLKKFRIITGWRNKLLYRAYCILPDFAINWILKRVFEKKQASLFKESPEFGFRSSVEVLGTMMR